MPLYWGCNAVTCLKISVDIIYFDFQACNRCGKMFLLSDRHVILLLRLMRCLRLLRAPSIGLSGFVLRQQLSVSRVSVYSVFRIWFLATWSRISEVEWYCVDCVVIAFFHKVDIISLIFPADWMILYRKLGLWDNSSSYLTNYKRLIYRYWLNEEMTTVGKTVQCE